MAARRKPRPQRGSRAEGRYRSSSPPSGSTSTSTMAVGAVFQVGGVFQHILLRLFLDHLDFHVRVLQPGHRDGLRTALFIGDVAAGAAGAGLLGRLLGAAFRARGRLLAQVIELIVARHADALGAELGFRHRSPHETGRPLVGTNGRRARPMPPPRPHVKRWLMAQGRMAC